MKFFDCDCGCISLKVSITQGPKAFLQITESAAAVRDYRLCFAIRSDASCRNGDLFEHIRLLVDVGLALRSGFSLALNNAPVDWARPQLSFKFHGALRAQSRTSLYLANAHDLGNPVFEAVPIPQFPIAGSLRSQQQNRSVV